jgi:dolichyl-phosphate beta-glucosyltransferase
MESSAEPGHLTLVIPAFNEELRLPSTLTAIRQFSDPNIVIETVIVADDGSTDKTADIVTQMSVTWPALRPVRLPHRGKGHAVRAGVLAAGHAEFIVIADADLSMPLDELPKFVRLLLAGSDVVLGSREGDSAHRFNEPLFRHVMGRVFNLLVRLLGLTDVRDSQCGFKAFSGQAALRIFAAQTVDGFAFDVEVLAIARHLGYAIEVVEIEWHHDIDSRVRPGIDSMVMLWDVFCLFFRFLMAQPRSTARLPRAHKASSGGVPLQRRKV